ncbi:glycosyltransferase family 4 protein [Variovorax paradoxus]|uniref:glycosyltransferase family 4 protein n=1 Tax=Variovorax paradoxus TaxID=34073 RepID=UPI002481622F|nr:glycosyltransferase family 4 protein [Variovorax paradoxus]WGT61704.1 glycosyltransferase family 4 protein [Variovorax paradoxus]
MNASASEGEAGASTTGRPQRILIAMCYLVHRTGAEMFTRDLALWLRRRGHAVTIFATAFGDMADELRHASIACITDVADMAARPDVIIGNTHHETVRALLHFHDVPVLTICHDRSAEHGRPPQFSQVVRHIAVDENCAERLEHEFGIEREQIELIQNGIDLSRFLPRATLPAAARTALVFSNYASHDAQLEEIRAACADRGLALDVIGSGTGNHLPDPAGALGRYDIVFGKGRCATEALVTGNAVVVLDPSSGMGEMVLAATVAHARRWNFGRALMTRPITRQNVMAELDKFDAQDAAQAASWMRANGGLDATLSALEACIRRMTDGRAVIAVPAERRAREMARYMDDWIRRGSTTSAHIGLASLHQHVAWLQQTSNDQQRAHQAQAEVLRADARRQSEHAAALAPRLQAAEAELAAQKRDAESAMAAASSAQAVLSARLDEAGSRLAEAERHAIETAAGMDARLREIYASRSWRVTAPLRKISTFIQARVQRP